jgi:hypothetical protein
MGRFQCHAVEKQTQQVRRLHWKPNCGFVEAVQRLWCKKTKHKLQQETMEEIEPAAQVRHVRDPQTTADQASETQDQVRNHLFVRTPR